MRLIDSITSTDIREGSSGGQLRTGLMRQWFQKESTHPSTEPANAVFLEGGIIVLTPTEHGTSSKGWEPTEEDSLRHACHVLINQLPEEGLQKLCLAVAQAMQRCGSGNVGGAKDEFWLFDTQQSEALPSPGEAERTLLMDAFKQLTRFAMSSDEPAAEDIGPRTGRFRE